MTARTRPLRAWAAHLAVPGKLAVAGAVGALWDEHLRAGFSTWQAMCRNGELGVLESFSFYVQLLPWSTLATLTTALLSLIAASSARVANARHALLTHASCWLAMPVSVAICGRIAWWDVASRWNLGSMFVFDFVLMAGTATALMWLTRPGQELNLRPLA